MKEEDKESEKEDARKERKKKIPWVPSFSLTCHSRFCQFPKYQVNGR